MSHKKTVIKKSSINKGFSLLEMIIYISVMALILVVVVNTLIVILSIHRDMKISRMIEHASISAFDRLAREIRDADSIDLSQSQFGINPGRLVLNTTDELGNPKKIEFLIESNIIQLRENSVTHGPLIGSQVRATGLVFYNLISSASSAVKAELTLEAGSGNNLKAETFYLTTVLRGF